MKPRLFTPGPTPVPEETLLELARPVTYHRAPEAKAILGEVTEDLKYVYQTANPVLTLTCSGTGGMESAVVNTLAAGEKAILLTAGAKGKRFALPHARILIHQPLAGFQGQATDIEIHAREIMRARDTVNELYAKHTGQPLERIERDMDRDRFMSAEEAKEYGLIDAIFEPRKKDG